jgi:hypothetical protein
MNRSTLLKVLARQDIIQEQINGLRCTLDTDRAHRKEVVISSLPALVLIERQEADTTTSRSRETRDAQMVM